MDEPSSSMLFTLRGWRVLDEASPRMALHVHGDAAAFGAASDIQQALGRVAAGRALTIPDLDASVGHIAEELGLAGSAGECRCAPDPQHRIVDVWMVGGDVARSGGRRRP